MKLTEKVRSYGAGALSEAELMAAILGTEKVTTINPGFTYSYSELRSEGLSETAAAKLLCVAELAKRINVNSSLSETSFSTPENIAKFCADMTQLDHEEFRIIYLSHRLKYKGSETLTVGTDMASMVSIRQTLLKMLRRGVPAAAVVHNHPGGDAEPSEEDIQVTKSLATAMETVGLRLCDHIIIAGNGYYSAKERGVL